MRIFKIVYLTIFCIAFLIFDIKVIIWVISSKKKKETNCTSKTYGKVVDIIVHKYSSYGKVRFGHNYWHADTLHPVFEYTIGEQKFIKESSSGSSECKYSVGQQVEIYYNPKDFNEYYVKDDNTQTFVDIFGIIIITIFAITCIAGIISSLFEH